MTQGVYAPLTGFMTSTDYYGVLGTMRLGSGVLWPLPIVLPVGPDFYNQIEPGMVVSIYGAAQFEAKLSVVEKFPRNLAYEAHQVYGTEDPAHPGVARLLREHSGLLAGRLDAVRLPKTAYPEPHWPHDVRRLIKAQGFQSVAFFQTRNPLHRAHEALLKAALESVDGLVLHPLVGPTKVDDVSAPVRMATYRQILSGYFPSERVILAVFPAAMRYAGPREALFHAITRKNYGATHFVVGRDAAGVGSFYPPDAARELVEACAREVGIVPLTFQSFGYCPVCDTVASARSCPHPLEWQTLSGTEIRHRLRGGLSVPPQIIRPGVARILHEAYQVEEEV